MRIKLLITLLLLGNLVVFAQNDKGQAFSLVEAIDYAYQNNLQLKNTVLNIADAEQQILERRAIGLPQVNGEINYQYFPQVPQMALPSAFADLARDPVTGELPPGFSNQASFQLKNNFTAGISASMLAYDGTYTVALKAARLYKEYVQEEVDSKKKEISTQVIAAYLPTLLIDEGLKLIDHNVQSIQQLFKETKALYQEGFVEQLDVDRLELSLANLQAERDNLIRQREMAINGLKFSMGYPKDKALKIADSIEGMIEAGNPEVDSLGFTLQNRPEYRLATAGLQLNELNIEQFRKGYQPNLAVFANYQYGYLGDTFSDGFWAPSFVVGAKVNIPIFDGFDKRSKIERAKIQLMTAQNQTKLLEQSIWMEIQNACLEFESAKNRVDDRRKNMELAERIFNTAKIKYREGVGSSLELTQAEQALFQAQNNYNTALYDAINAKIGVDSALGK